jgi:hypothetical protein
LSALIKVDTSMMRRLFDNTTPCHIADVRAGSMLRWARASGDCIRYHAGIGQRARLFATSGRIEAEAIMANRLSPHRPSLLCGLLISAWTLAPAHFGLAQTPRYIAAKPDGAVRTFGRDVAGRIFSDAYTPARRQALLRSQQAIPGFACPDDPQIALANVIPYPLTQGMVSWIERYVVACKPRTMRNFLLILEGGAPRAIELLPGTTNADPRLQRDAVQGAAAAAATVAPQG